MKNLRYISIALIAMTLFTSCERIFMEVKPTTDNLSIFDEYAELVKTKYAMLEFKGVDINFLADSIRSTITDDLTADELFDKLAIITSRLRDGHSDLTMFDEDGNATKFAGFDMTEGYPSGLDVSVLFDNYLAGTINPTIQFLWLEDSSDIRAVYGTLPQDANLGYLWIPSWNNDITDDEIDVIFDNIKDKKGLIFDMRYNTGGDPSLATKFASYFTDQEVYTGFERFKVGAASNDFADSPVTLQPTSKTNKFLKPVAVLTDRFVYSASTTFLYSVRPIDRFMTIGQRSGGGSGSVADGYLANGWKWSLSTSEFIDDLGRHLDDGVEPTISVPLDTMVTTMDEVVERAILELQ
jgi:hypothetical protein